MEDTVIEEDYEESSISLDVKGATYEQDTYGSSKPTNSQTTVDSKVR